MTHSVISVSDDTACCQAACGHDSMGSGAFARRGFNPLDANIAGRLAVTVYDTAGDLWLAQGATEPIERISATK